jgi:hypothetical protein
LDVKQLTLLGKGKKYKPFILFINLSNANKNGTVVMTGLLLSLEPAR